MKRCLCDLVESRVSRHEETYHAAMVHEFVALVALNQLLSPKDAVQCEVTRPETRVATIMAL